MRQNRLHLLIVSVFARLREISFPYYLLRFDRFHCRSSGDLSANMILCRDVKRAGPARTWHAGLAPLILCRLSHFLFKSASNCIS